jgi:hypothetical protein
MDSGELGKGSSTPPFASQVVVDMRASFLSQKNHSSTYSPSPSVQASGLSIHWRNVPNDVSREMTLNIVTPASKSSSALSNFHPVPQDIASCGDESTKANSKAILTF